MYIVPAQWGWVLEEVGLTTKETDTAAWVVLPSGEKLSGAAAISVAFDTLIGYGQLIYTIYRLPGIRQIEDRIYQFVADNRSTFSRWFSATPAIQQDEWQPER